MGHHEGDEIVSEAGVVSERDDGGDMSAVESKIKQCAQTKRSAECKRVDRDLDIVGHDLARAFLVRLVEVFPPRRLRLDIHLAKSGTHAGEF